MRLPREITGPIKRKLYPESAIKEAIRLVKEEKYSMRAASFATGCPPSTLHRRFFQGIFLAFLVAPYQERSDLTSHYGVHATAGLVGRLSMDSCRNF